MASAEAGDSAANVEPHIDLKRAYAQESESDIAESFFCPESRYFRVARDVFFYARVGDGADDIMWVVKAWQTTGHRASTVYGNAWGTFLVQAPKRPHLPTKPLPFCEDVVYDSDAAGYFFTFPKLGLGNKAALLAAKESYHKSLGFETSGATYQAMTLAEREAKILSFIADLEISGHIIPKEADGNKSLVKAEMTCLASFVELQLTPAQSVSLKIDCDDLIGCAALDPAENLHAGVLANFCIRENLCPQALAEYGWVGSEQRFPQISLSPSAISLRAFGGATSAQMAAHLKGIIHDQLQTPVERGSQMLIAEADRNETRKQDTTPPPSKRSRSKSR